MYKWTICEPLLPDIVEKGVIEKEKLVSTFESFPWNEMLLKMDNAQQSEIQYSPSLEVISEPDKKSITFSSVRTDDGYCFYVFFKRSKKVKKWFGFVEKTDPEYFSDVLDYTKESAIELLRQFVAGDFHKLEKTFE